jgi:hypothetical protein
MVRKNSTQKSEIVHAIFTKIMFNAIEWNENLCGRTYTIKMLSK